MNAQWTPWGVSEDQTAHDGGIVFHSTASHGGFYVPPHLLAKMPAAILDATWGGLGRTGWFEEDVDAAYVVSFFRDVSGDREVLHAKNALRLDLAYCEKRARQSGDVGGIAEQRYRLKLAAWSALLLAGGAQVTPNPKGWETADTTLYV